MSGWRARPFPRAVGEATLLFGLSRLWVSAFLYLAHSQRSFLAAVDGGWVGVAHWWLNPWTTYDSQWFVAIALQGYTSELSTTFFPLYPFLLRLAGPDEVRVAVWGLLLSNVAFLLALVGLYRLTEEELGVEVARWATLTLAFFATSVYFGAVYSESLFLCCLVWAFFFARRRRWLAAGLLACLASLTRNAGVVITLALLLEYGRLVGRKNARLVEVMLLLAPLLLFFEIQGYFAWRFDDALPSVVQQTAYNRAPMWPWVPVWRDLLATVTLADIDGSTPFALLLSTMVYVATRLLNLVATLLAFLLLFLFRKRLPPAYILLTWSILLMHLTYGRLLPAHTLSAARYLSATFPFVQAVALAVVAVHTRVDQRLLLPLFVTAYLLLNAVTTYLFGMKLFLG